MTPDPRDTDPLYVPPVVIRCRRCDNPLPFGRIGRCADCIGRGGNPVGCVLVAVLAAVIAVALIATPRVAATPSPAVVNVTASERLSGLTSSTPATLHGGQASWFDDGPGLYGAVNSYRWGDPTYPARVCRMDDPERCVTVTVRDHMANPTRAIDLSPEAFRRLAPLSRGVVQVTVSTGDRHAARPTLPATDTKETP